jgi:hypothetical protein
MATIRQMQANRRNAQKSTGPRSPEAKEKVRFNALVHGLRAQSTVILGESQDEFDQHLARVTAAWDPQDDFEQSLVEQIAINQWKLARIDRNEARIHDPSLSAKDYTLALHRFYLTLGRVERSVSSAIADLERYRKQRLERRQESAEPQEKEAWYNMGLLWDDGQGHSHYSVLPKIRGLDGIMREIPAAIMGDFPDPEEAPYVNPPVVRPPAAKPNIPPQ